MPRHNRPPPVPEHACNNLQSSSDDDESACPDYMDPELDLYRPPVPIPQGTKANFVRRGGYNTPADYIPNIDKLMPGIREDDEFLSNTQYVDPEKVFTNGPNIDIVSKKTENSGEMYTDGKKFVFYLFRTQIIRLLRSFISQTISSENVRKKYLKMGICTSKCLQNKQKTRTSKHVKAFFNQHLRDRYITKDIIFSIGYSFLGSLPNNKLQAINVLHF